ncbi:MAG TPA: bifunctional methylenetetrahydrofolate dehydrogenase/methenyltetrahydrofolate cyclohydrolase [Pseudomonadales bacterium]|nr:bifunctional methylenetetrahydrofolate dehydrogenase/methenyltetrahydrofolate cyclohydrolase [Pseudomonadales bacterium]
MNSLDPAIVAEQYISSIQQEVTELGRPIHVKGFIATDDLPSLSYAKATRQKFNEVGIDYDLVEVERLDLEQAIMEANADDEVHGIFIYFPVFHSQQDSYLRNLVDYRKDIEAGSHYWVRKLYANDRFAIAGDSSKKALLPCTPLAIIKMLTEVGVYAEGVERPVEGKIVTIFNRSEVNGRPLAVMMSNDGARVYSFDINGPLLFENAKPFEIKITRREALASSDIVITGVPHKSFDRICCDEIRPGTVCVNFSTWPNFEDDVNTHTDIYIPRVGPMTVAMCMRNTLRLFRNFHLATA